MAAAIHETAYQMDNTMRGAVHGAKRMAEEAGDATKDVAKRMSRSEPVTVAKSMTRSAADSVSYMTQNAWSAFLRFGHRHSHLSSAAILWSLLSAIPLAIWSTFTAGLFITTVVIAFCLLLPFNGFVLLFSGPPLLLSLGVTTFLAAGTYLVVLGVGIVVQCYRRIFPSTPAQRIDEGIASKY